VGLIVLLFTDGRKFESVRGIGLLFSLIAFLFSVIVVFAYQGSGVPQGGFSLIENIQWFAIPGTSLVVKYHLGVDGISVPMVLLTGLLSVCAAGASWNIKDRAKEYWIFFLLLQVGMYGTFVALDLFLFYIFWELVLVPMYFLIGIWGGPRREYAALKFFLYTFAGSVLMLIAFLALYFKQGTFQFPELAARAGELSPRFQLLIFLALFIGFAIKVPVFPFHTWLPDAHVEAPTPISVILAGVLLKMGTYGFFRFSFPLAPDMAHHDGILMFLAILGVVGIVYAAFVAFAQQDFKKLVAYSSVSHMGFVLLGLSGMTIMGLSGAYFQSFSHGLLSGAMFLLVGVLYDRTHTRDLNAFGGLLAKVPIYGGILFLFALGSLGLPGLSGFIGEFLVLFGAFESFPWLVAISGIGIVMTAAYILMMIRKILMGPLNEKWAALPEINAREIWILVPLGVATLVLGLYPKLLTNISDPSLDHQILRRVGVEAPIPRVDEVALEAFAIAEAAAQFPAADDQH
jgi:NADH-quinone oxidoreductase subunit M